MLEQRDEILNGVLHDPLPFGLPAVGPMRLLGRFVAEMGLMLGFCDMKRKYSA